MKYDIGHFGLGFNVFKVKMTSLKVTLAKSLRLLTQFSQPAVGHDVGTVSW